MNREPEKQLQRDENLQDEPLLILAMWVFIACGMMAAAILAMPRRFLRWSRWKKACCRCHRHMEGNPLCRSNVSHGMCLKCFAEQEADAEAMHRRRAILQKISGSQLTYSPASACAVAPMRCCSTRVRSPCDVTRHAKTLARVAAAYSAPGARRQDKNRRRLQMSLRCARCVPARFGQACRARFDHANADHEPLCIRHRAH